MKKVKTIVFSVAVVLVSLFLCSAGCQNAADSGGGGGQPGAAYSFDENSKTLTIHHDKYVYSIPDSIREVVVKAVIENGVRSIYYTYFQNSKNLVSVSIPSSVTFIGGFTFDGCESLRSVSIPNSVTKIDSWAFSGCKSLRSVRIPSSVTEMHCNGVFYGCERLTSVTVEALRPPILFYGPYESAVNSMFDGTSDSLEIYVPAGSLNEYKYRTQHDYGNEEMSWCKYADNIFSIQ